MKNKKPRPFQMHVGATLLELRTVRGLTQREMAKMIDVSMQQYQKYENGKNRISLEKVIQLCEELGVPLSIFEQD